mmetsp:Transcript_22347/g.69132  ORF Transcript_22347/g.69132 Transcript_22347/m.69132 type:complete len:154 (-) Transcript_22347:327-788(-)
MLERGMDVLEALRLFCELHFVLGRAFALTLGIFFCNSKPASKPCIFFTCLVKLTLQAELLQVRRCALQTLYLLNKSLPLPLALVKTTVHVLELAVGFIKLFQRFISSKSHLRAREVELELFYLPFEIFYIVLRLLTKSSRQLSTQLQNTREVK